MRIFTGQCLFVVSGDTQQEIYPLASRPDYRLACHHPCLRAWVLALLFPRCGIAHEGQSFPRFHPKFWWKACSKVPLVPLLVPVAEQVVLLDVPGLVLPSTLLLSFEFQCRDVHLVTNFNGLFAPVYSLYITFHAWAQVALADAGYGLSLSNSNC